MCTVTYLPTESGFIFTSNRDESPVRARATLPPAPYRMSGETLYFPRDPQGGTWYAVSEQGRIHCLLNGAFVKHKHQPPYRKSRGLVVLESLSYSDPAQFHERYDLNGIEPFTMVMLHTNGKPTLTEFRWDGTKGHLLEKQTDAPAIWMSAPLYEPEVKIKREQVFHDWLLQTEHVNGSNVMELHLNGSYGDPANDFRMNRGMVQTVSVTQLLKEEEKYLMYYNDLLLEQDFKLTLP